MPNQAQLAVMFADISGSTQLYVDLGDTRARDIVAHCIGVMLESHVAIADSDDRTTASENEQKKRVPVWFGTVGAAMI